VANASGSYFSGGSFIFDTEDGLVVYWNGSSNTAIIGKDNSASGAVYKGLALLGTNLLAANFNSGKVDVYDSNYSLTSLGGTFTDPNLPAGFAPHGIHVIGSQIYIAYAMQDTPKHDAVPGAGAGQVDIFDTNGNFVSTFVAAGAKNNLNAPWGVVQAPASFGTFANDILVSNFGDGTISAFSSQGIFEGQLSDSSGNVLVNPACGIWCLAEVVVPITIQALLALSTSLLEAAPANPISRPEEAQRLCSPALFLWPQSALQVSLWSLSAASATVAPGRFG